MDICLLACRLTLRKGREDSASTPSLIRSSSSRVGIVWPTSKNLHLQSRNTQFIFQCLKQTSEKELKASVYLTHGKPPSKSQESSTLSNEKKSHTLQVAGRWNRLPVWFHSLLLMEWNPSASHSPPNLKRNQ